MKQAPHHPVPPEILFLLSFLVVLRSPDFQVILDFPLVPGILYYPSLLVIQFSLLSRLVPEVPLFLDIPVDLVFLEVLVDPVVPVVQNVLLFQEVQHYL